ncbi:hypothetical protein GCM10027615_07730 [Plantactinospora veratri]
MGVRCTRPRSSNLATILVIVGGWTRSVSASSRGVSAPASSRLVNAESWVPVRSPTGRVCRTRRLSRVIASRNNVASCAGGMCFAITVHSVTVVSLTNKLG